VLASQLNSCTKKQGTNSTYALRWLQVQQVFSDNLTRNSAIADKQRDAFVQMQWPPKTRPSPYVLPCRIWSFCVKGCEHKWRRTQNWWALQLVFLGIAGVADPKIHDPHNRRYLAGRGRSA